MNIMISNNCYQPNFEACRFKIKSKPKQLMTLRILKSENVVSQNSFEKVKEGLKNYITGYPKRINYTAKHKKAFLKVEKDFIGKNTLSGYLHDLDKLIMYIIGVPKQIAHNIHVATAPHHFRNGKIKKPLQAVIDWECARYTKPDKPLSAREYYEAFFVKKQGIRLPEIEELLDKFGL